MPPSPRLIAPVPEERLSKPPVKVLPDVCEMPPEPPCRVTFEPPEPVTFDPSVMLPLADEVKKMPLAMIGPVTLMELLVDKVSDPPRVEAPIFRVAAVVVF